MLRVSPNRQFLAIFTTTGKLLVVTMDFSRIISDFDTKSSAPPEQLAWCGDDSVVLYWAEILLMVGPHGDWIKYSYEIPAKLTSEIDGLRVITSERHEFIFRVPHALVDACSIGSTTPAAMLRDVVEQFVDGPVKAERSLKSIGSDLPLAVTGCIRAACAEINARRQHGLLRAAYCGASYMSLQKIHFDPWALHKACTLLRILNAVRSPVIGIPLTYVQYCHTGLRALVERLISMHHHLLAARILSMQGKGTQEVLQHWAVSKIPTSTDVPDSVVSEIIRTKLASSPGLSYAPVAYEAHKRGRTRWGGAG